ncbi:MAG: sterol desaturase family protein, partial [Desulfobacterales bacterium]|nr:sterol desaturase family protein [Desulfobacterales bacterium]
MEHEATTRLAFFFGILVLVALGEFFSPRRALTMARPIRWFSNLGVVAVGALTVRLLFPFIGVHV